MARHDPWLGSLCSKRVTSPQHREKKTSRLLLVDVHRPTYIIPYNTYNYTHIYIYIYIHIYIYMIYIYICIFLPGPLHGLHNQYCNQLIIPMNF